MKRIKTIALVGMLALSLTACGSKVEEEVKNEEISVVVEASAENNTETSNTETNNNETAEEQEVTSGLTIEYPAHMKSLGFDEAVVLDKMPEKIVCLSTYPVLALFDLGVTPIALPSTKVIEYPSDYQGVILPSMMSENFDIESVVALEPDLVFMPASVKEKYDETFSSVNIPVYYMAMTVEGLTAYEVIKEQTAELVKAFDSSSDLMNRFDELETKIAEFENVTEGKSVFALTVSGDALYICGPSGTLGSMLDMCGLTNVYDSSTVAGHGMIELDLETAIEYTPDIVVITGSSTKEDNQAMFEAIYESNKEYWDSIEAVKEGRIIFLSSSYVSTAGMNIVNNIDSLMDELGASLQ